MKRITQFRRLNFEFEGCVSHRAGLSHALACHKGNASQEQESEQVGAQTQGVAVKGDKNTSNTGTEVFAAPTVTGSNSSLDASTKLGNNNSIVLTDDDATKNALDALGQAFKDTQANATQEVSSAIQSSNLATQQALQTAQQASVGTLATVENWFTTLQPWQVISLIVLTLGGVWIYLRRKKT